MIHTPTECNSRCYADPKPGAKNFFQVSHMGPGSQGFGPYSTALPGHMHGVRWEVELPEIRTGAHMGSRHIQGEDFSREAMTPGPKPASSCTRVVWLDLAKRRLRKVCSKPVQMTLGTPRLGTNMNTHTHPCNLQSLSSSSHTSRLIVLYEVVEG